MLSQNTYSGISRLRLVTGLTLFLLLLLLPSLIYAAVTPQDRLTDSAPALQKTADLAPNVAPALRDTDCFQYTYTPKIPANSDPRTVCAFETQFGIIGNGDEVFTGANAALTVKGIEGVSTAAFFMQPTPDSLQPVAIPAPTSLGSYLGFYRDPVASFLRLNGSGTEGYYTLKKAPDSWLKDDSQNLLLANTSVMAYSASGKYMVIDLPTIGLSRLDLDTFSIMPFAPSLERPCSVAPSFAKLAISNDGRYVAVSPQAACQNPTEPSLQIYDLTSCQGRLQGGVDVDADCHSKDIWKFGLSAQLSNAQRPANLRFINDQNLSFDVAYDYNSVSDFAVGSFLATVGGGNPHELGLLGLGDSYIAGEGAFNYLIGTDTAANLCHVSVLSYTVSLGKSYFGSNGSAACSGAAVSDLTDSSTAYKGQVTDGVAQKDRNIDDILSRFLPGYLNQFRFAEKYQPEALLLSVGGNDVGFADIVARCVAPSRTEPNCYDSYEDRADLVNLINSKYYRFASTFKTLRRTSPATRIYIVGYPQIAKPGGNCAVNTRLSAKEVFFSSDLISYLNSVIKQAAAEAGVYYVDTEQAFDGYRLCEGQGDKIAVNGLTAGNDTGVTLAGHAVKLIGNESFHPTAFGYQLLSAAIARTTKNLTAPLPAPQAALKPPGLNLSLAILQNVPKTGRPLKRIFIAHPVKSVVSPTSTQPLHLGGTEQALRPGGQYTVSLANEQAFASPVADDNGNLNLVITIPAQTAPGYQLLHIYGTDISGDAIDIQQTVYVADPTDDQTDKICGIVPDSQQDLDSDGIDDACDPVISAPPMYRYPPTVRLRSNVIIGGS